MGDIISIFNAARRSKYNAVSNEESNAYPVDEPVIEPAEAEPEAEPVAPLAKVAYIKLDPSKELISDLITFQGRSVVCLQALQGQYAYCLIEDRPLENDVTRSQYLILKPLDGADSNHGCLDMLFKKRIPGYNKDTWKVIVGGEITFDKDITWNTKSAGYSEQDNKDGTYGNFDWRNPNYIANVEALWMPGKFVYPESANETKPARVNHHNKLVLEDLEDTQQTTSVTVSTTREALFNRHKRFAMHRHCPTSKFVDDSRPFNTL